MTFQFSSSSFIAGVIFGALLAGAWFSGGASKIIPQPYILPVTSNTRSAIPQSGAVSVSSQPFGDSVFVESVTVPPPGVWVAVREVNGTDLGNVLGATHVGGPRSGITISLLRATEPNHSYVIELYRDDNNGAFDPATNSVYVDFDTGARVVVYFTATN